MLKKSVFRFMDRNGFMFPNHDEFGTFGTNMDLGTVITCSDETKAPLWYTPSEQAVAPFKVGYLISCVPLFQKILLKIIPKIKRKYHLQTRIYARIEIFWI